MGWYSLPQFERIWRDLTLFLVVNDGGTGVFDPVLVNRGGDFCSKSWLFEGAFLLLFSASWCAWICRAKKQQRLCNSIPAAEGLYRICWYARRLGDLPITIPGSTQLFNLFSLIVCHNPSAPSEGSSLLYLPHSLPKNSPHRYDIQIRNTKKAITLYDFSKI